MSVILQPKANPFGVFIFSPKDYSISLKQFQKKIENENNLNLFNNNSAYCNSTTNLYISGGNYYNKELNNFWAINNETFTIKKLYMKYPKSNHSMLYINSNNLEIIFFVGGNDSKSFYYDIRRNNFKNWGNTHFKHDRPSLIYIKNYIYCFDTSPKNKIIFERTYLNEVNKNWEKIIPSFENEKINFINYGFGACICDNRKIIFCGGDTVNINPYFYDIDKNLIYINDKSDDILFSFKDKNFYKINNNSYIALPNLEEEKEILIFNRNDYSLKLMNVKTKNNIKKDQNINKEKNKIMNNNLQNKYYNINNYDNNIYYYKEKNFLNNEKPKKIYISIKIKIMQKKEIIIFPTIIILQIIKTRKLQIDIIIIKIIHIYII